MQPTHKLNDALHERLFPSVQGRGGEAYDREGGVPRFVVIGFYYSFSDTMLAYNSKMEAGMNLIRSGKQISITNDQKSS